jgi:hypothetical protein
MLRVSWSQLRTFEECKQKGQLYRSDRRPAISNSRNFFPGTVTDLVVRDWLANDPQDHMGEMPKMVLETMKTALAEEQSRGRVVIFKHEKDWDEIYQDCIEAVTNIEPLLVQHVLPNDYMVDFRFRAPLGIPNAQDELEYIQLVGAMDIITRSPEGEWAVWDVKHTRDKNYWRKTVGQLGFYDLAVFAMFEADAKTVGLLQPLCPEPFLPYSLDDTRRSQLLQRVIAMAQDIWAGVDTPNGSPSACSFCDVKFACSKFKPIPGLKDRRMALL